MDEAEQLAALRVRYGNRPYEQLTNEQREFLLLGRISENTDQTTSRTVHIEEIARDGPLLKIKDHYSTWSRKKVTTGNSYASRRLLDYIQGTGDSNPEQDKDTYRFVFPDNSKLEVVFSASWDRGD